jgi:hypothetical protein
LVSPTPLIWASPSIVVGGAAAICRSVASWKITYGGMPSSFATPVRQARSRSNTCSASGPSSPAAGPAVARRARPDEADEADEPGEADRVDGSAGRGASRRNLTCRSPRSTWPEASVSASVP